MTEAETMTVAGRALRGQHGTSLALGNKVFLRGARHGEPGIVIRICSEKVTVLWPVPDHIGTYPHPAVELASGHEESVRTRTANTTD